MWDSLYKKQAPEIKQFQVDASFGTEVLELVVLGSFLSGSGFSVSNSLLFVLASIFTAKMNLLRKKYI